MKRDDRLQLLSLSTAELVAKLREVELELLKARQARYSRRDAPKNTRQAFMHAQTVARIKAELTRRTLQGEQA